ncbi:MAG: hypothetical protein ABIJ56_09955 [Pseudomonadota bacterium]
MTKLLIVSSALVLIAACSGSIGTEDAEEDPGTDWEATGECTQNSDCDDNDFCNGQERCNIDIGLCVAGAPPGNGAVCESDPRRICLDGECAQSRCGDGYADRPAGEECDPPDGETCSEYCIELCAYNEDCDDSDPCTSDTCDRGVCKHSNYRDGVNCGGGSVCCGGECAECCDETHCDEGSECAVGACNAGACVYDLADEGTECSGGVCCGGECVECCDIMPCEDGNECTADACSALGVCTATWLVDMTECSGGGVCCSGVCRPGGNCCGETDCGCTGEPLPCPFFNGMPECVTLEGCGETGEPACGSGYLSCGALESDGECEACGCTWEGASCTGDAICGGVTGSDQCSACNCTWFETGCTGERMPCETYGSPLMCDINLGCVWTGLCVSNVCT